MKKHKNLLRGPKRFVYNGDVYKGTKRKRAIESSLTQHLVENCCVEVLEHRTGKVLLVKVVKLTVELVEDESA